MRWNSSNRVVGILLVLFAAISYLVIVFVHLDSSLKLRRLLLPSFCWIVNINEYICTILNLIAFLIRIYSKCSQNVTYVIVVPF